MALAKRLLLSCGLRPKKHLLAAIIRLLILAEMLLFEFTCVPRYVNSATLSNELLPYFTFSPTPARWPVTIYLVLSSLTVSPRLLAHLSRSSAYPRICTVPLKIVELVWIFELLGAFSKTRLKSRNANASPLSKTDSDWKLLRVVGLDSHFASSSIHCSTTYSHKFPRDVAFL